MNKRLEQKLNKRGYPINIWKVLDFISHQGNANYNFNVIPLYHYTATKTAKGKNTKHCKNT